MSTPIAEDSSLFPSAVPRHRLAALVPQQPVDAAERPRPEEAPARRQRRRVRRLDPRDPAELPLERLRVTAPEDRGARPAAGDEGVDRAGRDLLPATAAMAG